MWCYVHTYMHIYNCQKYTVHAYSAIAYILFIIIHICKHINAFTHYVSNTCTNTVYLLPLHEKDNHLKIWRYVYNKTYTEKRKKK